MSLSAEQLFLQYFFPLYPEEAIELWNRYEPHVALIDLFVGTRHVRVVDQALAARLTTAARA